ncbi:MAG: response regulator [Chloroflexia bacterium]
MPEGPVDILVIEDSVTDLELMLYAWREKGLAERAKTVRDGAEALDFLFYSDHLPKVILLDLKLPKLHGLEVLRQVKSHPRTCTIPVVVLTSSGEECDVAESYRLGANSYVVKPVAWEEFKQTVTQVALYWTAVNRV